jgi:hypothetical protein
VRWLGQRGTGDGEETAAVSTPSVCDLGGGAQDPLGRPAGRTRQEPAAAISKIRHELIMNAGVARPPSRGPGTARL